MEKHYWNSYALNEVKREKIEKSKFRGLTILRAHKSIHSWPVQQQGDARFVGEQTPCRFESGSDDFRRAAVGGIERTIALAQSFNYRRMRLGRDDSPWFIHPSIPSPEEERGTVQCVSVACLINDAPVGLPELDPTRAYGLVFGGSVSR